MNGKHNSKSQRFLSGFGAVQMILMLTVSAFAADMTDFTDISGHQVYDAVCGMVEWEYVNSYKDGHLKLKE